MRHLLILIKQEIKSYPGQYLWLFTMGVIFLALLGIFQGEQNMTMIIIILFCFAYIIWGLIHHGNSKTLHIKNVLEYIIIGFTFCFIILLLLIQ